MEGFLVFEIVLLALIIGMLVWFRTKSYARLVEYRELKKKCEEATQKREEAESAAQAAILKETLAQQNLQSINENVKLGIEQLRNNENALYNQERIIKEKIVQERSIWLADLEKQQQEVLLEAQKDFVEQFTAVNKTKLAAAQQLTAQVDQLRSTVASAVEIARHKMEEENAQDFYRLQLPQESIEDIKTLRSIENLLHNPEAINKVIWKMYYEKPYTDLVGRLGISANITGIYKITNIENQMTYIGQARDITERWRQHIRRGVGADTPTQNKLYPAMKKYGPENFTFELIEKCSVAQLNAREDYWQEFYKAKEFGYSIK